MTRVIAATPPNENNSERGPIMNPNPTIDGYSRNPLLVYWETTRACALSCRHCRASAMPTAHPLELSHEEGLGLLEQIASFGDPMPHLVLTGGDPLRRKDLFDLIAKARELGIDVSITPAAGPDLTRDMVFRLKDAGIDSIALSLDASTADAHDAIRQVEGCFAKTMEAAKWCGEAGVPLQVNTLLSSETASDLPAVYDLLQTFPVMRWALFFLISVGRGKQLQEVSPQQAEEIMNWTFDLARKAPFQIKTTEAPSYRRVARERMTAAGMTIEQLRRTNIHKGYGIRDGNGITFVSHMGDVYPSGFLPLKAGNIRLQSLVDIYRSSEVFLKVRDVNNFEGKCGLCEYRKICGGSRARAFAHTGNPAGSDPVCVYQPKQREVALAG
ncbi:MAG TPA: TIGR04053 family radical SAM/SPASM domain-containing protein [Fimbriimonadaceae bacterium]|nr:TIGR04053 family radical SAM/SPASM domain-containing protein [Fimbriimonadaceae bacterium]